MSPSRADRLAAWVLGPRALMAFAVTLLFLIMALSFVNIPWTRQLPPPECGGSLCEITVADGPVGQSIAKTLFGPYAILVLVSALLLAACMIGGVYLAKAEEGGPP